MVSPMRWLSMMQAYVLHWKEKYLATLMRRETNWQNQTSLSSKCLIRTLSVAHNYFRRKINKQFLASFIMGILTHLSGLVKQIGSGFICTTLFPNAEQLQKIVLLMTCEFNTWNEHLHDQIIWTELNQIFIKY